MKCMEAIKEILGVGRFASVDECVEAARVLSEGVQAGRVRCAEAEVELVKLRGETAAMFAAWLEGEGYSAEAVDAGRKQWERDPHSVALAMLGSGDLVEAARGCNQHKHKPGCDAADGGDGEEYKDSPVPVVKKAKSVGEVGALVKPKPEWQNPGEKDFEYVVLEDQGSKILVQALGTGLKLPPTEVWMKDWAELSRGVKVDKD